MESILSVPGNYSGREHAWIKHQLLKGYLERLLMIIGVGGGRKIGELEICYVDCFAGPWGDTSENLEGTSIAVSLQTMESCRKVLQRLGVTVHMRALFIERDAAAFERLDAYLQQSCPEGVKATCLEGDFVSLIPEILKWCGRRAFVFFFIDPTGWKTVGVTTLKPLLDRPGSEFLINFMYGFINRTASISLLQTEIAAFLGCDVGDVQSVDSMAPDEREAHLVHLYREGLKRNLALFDQNYHARTAHVRVLDPSKNRSKYHLIYLTTHPKGIVVFMETSEKLDMVQRSVRATLQYARKEQQSGTADLFGAEGYAPDTHQVSPVDVDAFWLQYLHEKPTRVDEKVMADLMESTDWMPGDYQASLVRLIAEGHVRNLDALKPRRSKPLHYEKDGERLVLLPLPA